MERTLGDDAGATVRGRAPPQILCGGARARGPLATASALQFLVDVWFAPHVRWQPSYVERMFDTCHRRDHCCTVAPAMGARPRCRISPGVRHDDVDTASAPGRRPFRPLRRRAAAHATHPRAARDRRGPAGGLAARPGAPPPRPPAGPGPLSARLVPPVRGAELLCSRSGDRGRRTGGRSPAPSGRLPGGRRRRRRSGLGPTITGFERVRSEECAGRTPCRVTTNGGRSAAPGQGDTSRAPPRRRHPARPGSAPLLEVADGADRRQQRSRQAAVHLASRRPAPVRNGGEAMTSSRANVVPAGPAGQPPASRCSRVASAVRRSALPCRSTYRCPKLASSVSSSRRTAPGG